MAHVLVLFATSFGGILNAQTTLLFPDPSLEYAVRLALAKPTGAITTTDLQSLKQLNTSWSGISDLSGLEWATNLSSLSLSNNLIADPWPLAGLSVLTNLNLSRNPITNCAPLAQLTNLVSLDLSSPHGADESHVLEHKQ